MCGIIGYIGKDSALPIIIDALKRLEYRGYDSAGVAVLDGLTPIVRKRAGRISDLETILSDSDGRARIGIGHTRWATHGAPTDDNAHPHCDCKRSVMAVHNGIIENYLELRDWLTERGHTFASSTDTEVIPHLVEHHLGEGQDFETAVRSTVGRLRGAYAMVVMSPAAPDRLVLVRHRSPLVIGIGQGEHIVASDIPAILRCSRDVIVMQDGDMAVVTADSIQLTSSLGQAIKRPRMTIDWAPEQAERGGFPHFMLKEIHEQPEAVEATLRGRIDPETLAIDGEELGLADLPAECSRVQLVACGTAYHAGLVGSLFIERLARIPTKVHLASEFRYGSPIVDRSDLVIAISQSGETADTLASIDEAKRLGARVLAITNVVGSSVARDADSVLYTRAGPEVAVPATKTYTCQVAALALAAAYLARGRARPDEVWTTFAREICRLPELLAETLAPERVQRAKQLAEQLAEAEHCFFLGRDIDFSIVQEGQLKMKEISYIHAEALAAGELKHGTLALITPGTWVVCVATQPALYDKVRNNLAQVVARGGRVVVVTFDDNPYFQDHHLTLRIPTPADPLLGPVLAVVPLQLLAYYAGVRRGCDVDKPRNLAKSVTVE